MKWTDTQDIVIKLEEQYPSINILGIRFTDLHKYVLNLEGFDDEAARCNEKILEAIQMLWLEERDC